MRSQQHKPGKQQHAQNAEFDIGATLQKPVPFTEVLRQGHQQDEDFDEDQHRTAPRQAFGAQSSRSFRILSAAIKTAAQIRTTRFPASARVLPACHGCGKKRATVLSHISEDPPRSHIFRALDNT